MIAQDSRNSPFQPKTFLYARILLWVTIPLFFLGVLFTAIQLTQQITTLNKITRVESEVVLKNIQRILQPEFLKEENFSDSIKLRNKIEKIRENTRVLSIDCFDVLENKPLFSSSSWTPEDIQAIEEIIPRYNPAAPYETRLNKNLKQLISYLIFHGPDGDSLYVTKIIFSLNDVKTALRASRKTLVIMFAMLLLIGFIISQGLSNAILRPLKLLDRATREIKRGALGSHVSIHTGDEIETLANTFNQMSDALEEMTRKAQDSNPLTGLPGNIGILHNLQKRILDRQKFIMFHCDLDRFKVFNDHFGLAMGDKAIKVTADLLKKAAAEKGGTDAFVGHQGGDDFVMIVRPQRAEELGKYVCEYFKSSVVSQLYKKEDYDNGYVMQLDRRRQTETGEAVTVQFPLISISLAGISNAVKDFADYADCMSRVAPVKKEVKQKTGSNYLIKE